MAGHDSRPEPATQRTHQAVRAGLRLGTAGQTTYGDRRRFDRQRSLRRAAASAQDCGGKNVSLPLAWSNAPSETQSFAVTIFDPDGARGLGIVHWILYGIPAATTALGEGGPPPAGSVGGINRTGKDGYYGPCPPHGDAPHHYVVQAYALDLAANALPAALDRNALIAAMKGHVLASSSMVVRYAR